MKRDIANQDAVHGHAKQVIKKAVIIRHQRPVNPPIIAVRKAAVKGLFKTVKIISVVALGQVELKVMIRVGHKKTDQRREEKKEEVPVFMKIF